MSDQHESFETGEVMLPDSSEPILQLIFRPHSFVFLMFVIFLTFEHHWGHIGIRTGRTRLEGHELLTLPTLEIHYHSSKPGLVSRVQPQTYLRSIIWREFKQLW